MLGSIPVFLAIALVVLRTLKLGACAFRNKSVGPIAAAWYVLLLSSFTDSIFGGLLEPPAYLFWALLICVDALTLQHATVSRCT